jgi:hypothetical protein
MKVKKGRHEWKEHSQAELFFLGLKVTFRIHIKLFYVPNTHGLSIVPT